MIIYSAHITPRLQYIVTTLLGNDVAITTSQDEFIQASTFKINYSLSKITDDELWIVPHSLLHQTTIQQQTIDCFKWNGLTAFFKTNGNLPFDVFAASFYLISRYEEYLPNEKDEHGRYAHTNSIAYTKNFLQQPLVDLWLQKLAEITSDFRLPTSDFCFLPTYDIDIAYQYQHQPIIKNVYGFFRDVLKGNFDKVVERGNVYSGNQNDPFDTFDWLDEMHTQYGLQPIYFLLTLLKYGDYDKNVLAKNKAVQKLYQQLSKKYTVGLHPSYKSSEEEISGNSSLRDSVRAERSNLIRKEKELLEKIINQPITISRNHYLRFTIPLTYRKLIAIGHTDDYSMAYSTINGFRASTSKPFYWYDVEKEITTALLIHPFSYMEANSFFHQKFSAQEAAEEMQYYYDIIKSVNGTYITLFHNHFLTEQSEWIEWRNMYAMFLKNNCN